VQAPHVNLEEHAWLSLRDGHAVPPQEAAVTMLRVLVCVPLPHFAEQALQSLQSETTQSTGGLAGLLH